MSINKTIATPLSDEDIHQYLPDVKILKYSQLKHYTLNELLPEIHTAVIILYESSPNAGHWVCISRPDDKIIEFFSSYGDYVDNPLNWNSIQTNSSLGQNSVLSQMFSDSPDDVVYNKTHYQQIGNKINDCGRWVVLRILMMQKGLDLNQSHNYVKRKMKELHLNADETVSTLIP
jgi:hypothetical protein